MQFQRIFDTTSHIKAHCTDCPRTGDGFSTETVGILTHRSGISTSYDLCEGFKRLQVGKPTQPWQPD